MTRKVVLLAAFAFLLPSLAMAGSVSFSTTGTFGNGTSTSGVFTGLSWVNASYTHLDAGPPVGTNVTFGAFHFTHCSGTCTGSDTFTLHIDQTFPNSGGGDLDALISGTVTASKGKLTFTFSKFTVTIGTVTYTVPAGTQFIAISHPGQTFALTTVTGNVFNPVGEPNARLLLGLGTVALMGLTLVSRKMLTI
jgi:hypothetical protein